MNFASCIWNSFQLELSSSAFLLSTAIFIEKSEWHCWLSCHFYFRLQNLNRCHFTAVFHLLITFILFFSSARTEHFFLFQSNCIQFIRSISKTTKREHCYVNQHHLLKCDFCFVLASNLMELVFLSCSLHFNLLEEQIEYKFPAVTDLSRKTFNWNYFVYGRWLENRANRPFRTEKQSFKPQCKEKSSISLSCVRSDAKNHLSWWIFRLCHRMILPWVKSEWASERDISMELKCDFRIVILIE